MALEDTIYAIRSKMESGECSQLPDKLQDISKKRIQEVLNKIDLCTDDQVDAVFALLDVTQPSWFGTIANKYKFADGASTAHIACHVGILQRGKRKLDREGRDYWLKPLWQIEAVEKVTLEPERKEFLPGHLKSKSPNSAYKLANGFKAILQAPDNAWQSLLSDWIKEDKIRERRELQAKLAAEAKSRVDSSHSNLIKASREHYCKHFLPDFEVIYVDDGDGDRISEAEKKVLLSAGITITLADSMPDVLLWNRKTDALWVIEAVTSDGEVDYHKMDQLKGLAKKFRKSDIGFTTTYPNWKTCAARQQQHKNIAPNSYIWIEEDPSKQFKVESFN